MRDELEQPALEPGVDDTLLERARELPLIHLCGRLARIELHQVRVRG